MKRFREWYFQKLRESTIPYVLKRPEGEINVVVHFDYEPQSYGARGQFGVPQDPDNEEGFIITDVEDENQNPIDITDKERKEIERFLFNPPGA